jgi:hypothetical protein
MVRSSNQGILPIYLCLIIREEYENTIDLAQAMRNISKIRASREVWKILVIQEVNVAESK